MKEHSLFVDLRVLLVHPDQGSFDLLQMALEGFRFDRITHVQDIESAKDQLCFNSFDLLILSEGISAASTLSLLRHIDCGDLGSTEALDILYLHPKEACMQELPKRLKVHYLQQTSSSGKLHDGLKNIFAANEKKRVKPEFLRGRAAPLPLVREKR